MKYLINGLSRFFGFTACLIVLSFLSGCKPTISFTALQSIITPGQQTELDWEVEFAKGSGDNVIEISPNIGLVEPEGSITITPTDTTTYTLKTRSFVFGFPMFVKEELTVEVKDGRFWDFTDTLGGVADWAFSKANYLMDDELKYVFRTELDQPVPDLGYSAVLLSADHDDPEDVEANKLIMYGTANQTGLEDDTDYDVILSVVYAVAARRDVNDNDCDMPKIELLAYVGLEEPEIEIEADTNNDDFVSVLNLSDSETNMSQLSPDITIADATDDTCDDDGVFQEASASTAASPISTRTDSDGQLWITIALMPTTPNMTVYLRSVTAIFEEQ